jgi:hypothetical protein
VARTSLLIALAVAVVVAAPARARTYRISIESARVVALGPVSTKATATSDDVRRAFGMPTSIKTFQNSCRIGWSSVGLSAVFASFGAERDTCGKGALQTAVVRSRVWRTWAGLSPGMRSSRVKQLHHDATFRRGKWVLASADLYGIDDVPTVSAMVSGGRVRALSLYIGGAGE